MTIACGSPRGDLFCGSSGLVWATSDHKGSEEQEGKTICSRQDAKSAKFGITLFFAAFAALREKFRVLVAA